MLFAFHHAPVGMAITDPHGWLRVANPALERLLGRALPELQSLSLLDLTHPDDVPKARQACAALQFGGETACKIEVRMLGVDGTSVHCLVSASKVCDVDGRPTHLVMHIEDVNQYKQLTEQLWGQAMHDALTGLPHRALLMDRLANAMARHHRDSVPVSVLFVDLDQFKDVNDTYGHGTGDRVLEVVAERMNQHVRPGDTVARVGGDEFVILCEQADDGDAAELIDRLQRVISEPISLDDMAVRVSASIGSATTVLGHGITDAHFLRKADDAMYAAKRATKSTHQDQQADADGHHLRRKRILETISESTGTPTSSKPR